MSDDLTRLFMVSDVKGQEHRTGTGADMPAMLLEATTKAEDGELRTQVVASTPDVDRASDIVEQDWKLANFRKNPVILWMHDRMTPPVGRAAEVKTTERGKAGRLEMSIVWDAGEHNALGTLVGNQYARGFLHAVSVGFMPGKRVRRADLPKDDPRYQELAAGEASWMSGLVLSQNELLENSAVTVPANANALAIRSWALEAEDPREQARRSLTETVARADVDWLLKAFDDPRLRSKIQAILLAMPEPEDDLERLLKSASKPLSFLFPAPSAD